MLNCFKMTHAMYHNRTPKRSIDCDDSDHVPSSKKMKTKSHSDFETVCASHDNALSYPHNPLFLHPQKHFMQQAPVHIPPLGYQNNVCIAQNNVYLPHEECSSSQSDFKYEPYLSAAENPHYYDNNKLLFELHVERIQRAPPMSSSASSSQRQSF